MRPDIGGGKLFPLTLALGAACGTQGSGRRIGRSLAQQTHVQLPPESHTADGTHAAASVSRHRRFAAALVVLTGRGTCVGYWVQGLGIHCGKAEAAERDLTELCPAVGAADENRCGQSEPSRCAAGCRDGGMCNEELARCDCKLGRRGEACEIFESEE